ncbi:hypothetical protein [Gilvibacter sediminis]|uniref:hypothetical protein n=1 Tax=Gilvibacter sediminis TaxID=379071 RepID=UPI00234FC7EC|nr:hypothetical protein [Gilvibacter sediminis]MDC7996912.1 hypothetical protein [Gilvibacter sediminis]
MKNRTHFDPGKILFFVEQILEASLISLENYADKALLNSGKNKSLSKEKYLEHLPDYDNRFDPSDTIIDQSVLISKRSKELERIRDENDQELDLETE